MATDNKQISIYLPDELEPYITCYCTDNGFIRKDGRPIIASAIVEILKQHFGQVADTTPVLDDGLIDDWADQHLERHLDKIIVKYLQGIVCLLPNSTQDIPKTDDRLSNEQIPPEPESKAIEGKKTRAIRNKKKPDSGQTNLLDTLETTATSENAS